MNLKEYMENLELKLWYDSLVQFGKLSKQIKFNLSYDLKLQLFIFFEDYHRQLPKELENDKK